MTQTSDAIQDLRRRLTHVARGWPQGAYRASDDLWFGPRLSEAEIAAHEVALGVRFPQEHREFLREIGNGGQAFDMRLLSLTEVIDAAGSDGCRLNEPFPFTGDRAQDEQLMRSLPGADGDESYQGVHGALRVGDEGCARYDYLVLNGPHAGSMWHDGRDLEQPFLPHGLSFLEWLIARLRSG